MSFSLILTILFLILLFLGLPIAFILGFLSVLYIIMTGDYSALYIIPQRLFGGQNNFVILAVPLFILAGEMMNKSNVSKNILKFATILVGKYRGGLGLVNVLASMLFGGITGSALADVAALGPLEIEMMTAQGYDRDFSTAVTAASALQGPIIPPSIPALLIAAVTGISAGSLFLGCAIPGIMVGLGAMFVVVFVSKKRNYPIFNKKYSIKEFIKSFFSSFPALFSIVIILGGIVGGVFTPTEAAAVAVVYVLFLSIFYKTFTIDFFKKALLSTLVTTSKIFFIVGCATVFSWVLAIENIPQTLSVLLFQITDNKYILLLIINIIILFWGMWMDTGPAIIILIPILLPVIENMGINQVHFGVVMIVNLMIGQITPPFGMTLYTAQAVGKTEFIPLAKNLIPFVLIDVVVLFVITYFPKIVLWLPSVFKLL